jgi:hypothetical protein
VFSLGNSQSQLIRCLPIRKTLELTKRRTHTHTHTHTRTRTHTHTHAHTHTHTHTHTKNTHTTPDLDKLKVGFLNDAIEVLHRRAVLHGVKTNDVIVWIVIDQPNAHVRAAESVRFVFEACVSETEKWKHTSPFQDFRVHSLIVIEIRGENKERKVSLT